MAAALVGRVDEVALLRGLIDRLPDSSAAVLVRGEAGIGKTVLVEAVLDQRPGDGPRVLRGGCAPMAGAAAYSGLDVALGGALGAHVAVGQFPSPAAGRARAMELLREALEDGPPSGTIVLIEDVHWADWSTLDFLAYASRNLPPHGLLILQTWRDEDTDADRNAWLADQLRNPGVTDFRLRRLTAAETVEQVLNLRKDSSYEEAARIHRRSGGNPYLTAELATDEQVVPASLRDVLLGRLQVLTPEVRMVVAGAGTLARPLGDDELLAVAGGDADVVRSGCEAGVLLRDPVDGTTARHPVLAEIAYENLLPPERRQVHVRLAHHLDTHLSAAAGPSSVAEVAEQYRRAGDRAATLRWSVEAARAAEASFALAEAGHWYAAAATVVNPVDEDPAIPSKLTLAQSAASLLGGAGQQAAAIAVLDGVLAGCDDGADLVPALLVRSWLRMHVGDSDGALRDVERARLLVPPRDELLLGRTLARHAMVLLAYSRGLDAVEPATNALELARRSVDTRTVGQAMAVLGIVKAADCEYDDGLHYLRTAMSIAGQVAEPEDIAFAGVGLSYLYGVQYKVDEQLEVLRLTQRELRHLMSGRHWLEDILEANVIEHLYELGRWDEALSLERPSVAAEFPNLDVPLAMVHLARGEFGAATELLQSARVMDRPDQPMHKLAYARAETEFHLHEDRPGEALAVAIAAAEAVHGTEEEPEGGELLLAGLEAAAAQQRSEEFERLVSLLRRAVRGVTADAVSAMIEAERSRIRGGFDPDPWLSAVNEWKMLGHPYREARARLRAAEACLARRGVAGARARAATELEAARRTAESLGAAPLLEKIRELAKLARIRLGDAVIEQAAEPDRAPHDIYALTDRERQVLALLADGQTNREIGAALYMSPKTASVHVTHILEKLGVQTRVQAAAIAVRLDLHA